MMAYKCVCQWELYNNKRAWFGDIGFVLNLTRMNTEEEITDHVDLNKLHRS